jgi:alkanesulfonate monooxygenase SsuD/methylene tetrahydromethanopterin reductase-like flavin-dependent oxidoreductase (luciferase family)
VRLGTAILIAPLRPAVQIAEEAAIVDLISDGRLDLGLGAGYRVPEFEAFGADVTKRFSATFERARQIRTLLAERRITPGPVQDPLPIWLGYRQAAGAYRTGLLGEGLQRADHALLPPYLDGLKAGGHDPGSARMAGGVGLVVADDPERAWQEIRPRLSYMWDSYHQYSVEGTDAPVPAPIDPDRWRQSIKGRLPRFQVLTPADAVDFIARSVDGLPVADLSVWASIAGMSGALVQRHIELFLTQVRPKVRHLGIS